MAAKKRRTSTTVTLSKKELAALGLLVTSVTKHRKKGDRIRIGGLEVRVGEHGTLTVRRNPATSAPTSIKSGKRASHTAVVGTTPDGVKILRPIKKPDHFSTKKFAKPLAR